MIRKLAFLLPLAFTACAVVQPPPGGPVDSVAVEVLRSAPAAQAVSVPRNSVIELQWSKWVEPTSLGKALTISPTPPSRTKIDVNGATIRLSFAEPLDSPATYVVRFAPGIKDYHDGTTRKEIEIPFATGPALDSGLVEVKVLHPGAPPSVARTGERLGLYPLDSLRRMGLKRLLRKKDSLAWLSQAPKPWQEKPLLSATVDSLGIAHVTHVPPGRYLVVSCTDKSKDGFCRLGSDSASLVGTIDWSQAAGIWRATTLAGAIDTTTPKPATPPDTAKWSKSQRDSASKVDSLARLDSLRLDSAAARDTARPSDSMAVVRLNDSLLVDSLHAKLDLSQGKLWVQAWPIGPRTRPVLRPWNDARLPLKPGRWRIVVWQDKDGDQRPSPSNFLKDMASEPVWIWPDRDYPAGFDGAPTAR